MVICSGELDAFERLTTDTEGDETDEDSGGILNVCKSTCDDLALVSIHSPFFVA